MKIVFRLNYHTHPGQSLCVRLVTRFRDDGVRVDQELPMRWINDRQWQAEMEVSGVGPLELDCSYELRQDWNAVVLDEWVCQRSAEVDPAMLDALLLEDTWCSAGTVDYAFETKAFDAVLPRRGPFSKVKPGKRANHTFQLRMAAVPVGLVPCMIGGAGAIGNWDWHHAAPMQEVAGNVWSLSLELPVDWKIEYKYGLFDPKLGRAVSLEEGENRVLSPRVFGERQRTIVRDEGYRRKPSELFHGAGVAIPVFSLRSKMGLGIGEFADLKPLADWADGVGLKLIQILPINDTTSSHDWTDSYPYSAISVFALHPIYLRVDDLKYEMGSKFYADLDSTRRRLNLLETVDYEQVMKAKTGLLKRVFAKHGKSLTQSAGFRDFLEVNRDWVLPYAAFCVLRDQFGSANVDNWGDWSVFDRERVEEMANPRHEQSSEIFYHIWLQYELDRQLGDAVEHLHGRGLGLKGDLPIGIDRQSVDAWSAPHLFKMDAQAGAPPDAFAVKGQNWGFPTYHWEVMRLDGYAWWRSRFEQLSRYFDAYRIDHILGFFRIWQIPIDQIEGVMGWFDPAIPVHLDEFAARGIYFNFNRFCRPYIREHFLHERFGDAVGQVLSDYLVDCGHGTYQLREHVSTQRRIVDHFASLGLTDAAKYARMAHLRDGLMDCASEVLFLEVPGSHGSMFHPRCSMQATRSFQELDGDSKWRIEQLDVDYFFRRQEDFWQARGLEKLPAMRRASRMLLCGEDLGMVPACVPDVLRELGILSLEIQRMPKSSETVFGNPATAPYMSVVSPSTHDMPTLRGWWREDPSVTGSFAWHMLGIAFPPLELNGEMAASILLQHLNSPAMWAIFPLQDLLAIDESLRHPDPDAERINVPAIMPYCWRYRMHLDLAELAAAHQFNDTVCGMIRASGR